MSSISLTELFNRAVESTASTLQIVGDDGILRGLEASEIERLKARLRIIGFDGFAQSFVTSNPADLTSNYRNYRDSILNCSRKDAKA